MRLLLIVALATVAAASLPPMFGGRRKGGFTRHLHENLNLDPSILADPRAGSGQIDQKLDHFDESNTKTWKQHFFYNDAFHSPDSNVNFLYLSGEQTASVDMVLGGSYVYYASTFNASLYALEHRFYGASHPTSDTSLENLKYLSSRQAIEDIAEFITQKNKEKGGVQKWIVVGGSYSGSVAAWARLLHPELIAGSLASSGPVLAQMDFYGYLETVDNNFKAIGGLCYEQLSKGLEKARELLQSEEGRAQLSTQFRIVPSLASYEVLTKNDIDTFYSYLINQFESQSQYGSPAALCKKFTVNGPDYDPLAALKTLTPGLMNVNFEESIKSISGTQFRGDISERLWIYQTCTEFGYFQSTNRGTNVFGQIQSTSTFIDLCSQLFGVNADQIEKNIEDTNAFYGERDFFAGTNVVFSHGTQDPWTYLSKKNDSRHSSVVIVEVEGGSHCSDLGASCFTKGATCNENMKQIQQLTLENMQRWINPTEEVPDRIDIDDHTGERPLEIIAKSAVTPRDKNRATRIEKKKLVDGKRFNLDRWNKFTGKGRRSELHEAHKIGGKADTRAAGTKWIEQTYDHFNPNEKRTFKQKWFYNYVHGSSSGPNFLMIGGEGPEDIAWVQYESLAWMTYAKEVGANVFVLEHRYYGESKLGTNDLQYLTSAQMLYDVAHFIKTQQADFSGPWITFGGSYPGALAAWSREWFPDLILGAVGSSGPVLAKTDFYEYLEVVEDVIKRESQKCYDKTTAAFERLRVLSLTPNGRQNITKKFKLWPGWKADEIVDDLDMNEVFSGLYGIFQGTVQYNSADWRDVKNLCAPFESDKYDDPIDALRAAQENTYGKGTETLSQFDYEISYYVDMLQYVDGHDSKAYTDDDLAGVLWMWQTCNEFGYYQTTDYGEGIFGTPVPVNLFITMCERIYNVGMDHVEGGVKNTNYQYGERRKYKATNVVLPNGDADPWHALGLLERTNTMDKSVVPIVIEGTSHCMDMNGATLADPPQLTEARKTILANIKKWLFPAPPVAESYCNCGLVDDKPAGWNATDVWVDVIVLLDTSASMDLPLEQAKSLINSFVSVLSTDISAKFYSLVGVISVSDTAQIVYNLNMSSTDTLDNVMFRPAATKADAEAGFEAAAKMFTDGRNAPGYRKNAKQIIYYLTNSSPDGFVSAASDFKAGGGTIIVNDFVTKGQAGHPPLRDIASDNFYFSDLTVSSARSAALFCEVNCFCAAPLQPFNDDNVSPRTAANRGCYNPVNNESSQRKAREWCDNAQASLVSIHDAQKEFFVSSAVSSFGSKKKYWIGYENVNGEWTWDDNSSPFVNSFTDWDVNQPNTSGGANCAYAVQTTGLNVRWTAADCAMAGVISICESAPCYAGNKYC